MHVIVPTLDLVTLLVKLRPMRSLVTSGFQFAIYTLEAANDKLKLIIGDRSSITASMEIFAHVKKAGRISVNGTDFYESIIRITPDVKSTVGGSKEITLQGSDTKLSVSTITYYNKLNIEVPQKRTFHRVTTDLATDEHTTVWDQAVHIKAAHMSEILKTSNRLISAYTSDMTSLSGVLLRIKKKKLRSIVSDGMRILEVTYPHKVKAADFDVSLPKLTSTLLQSLLEEGDDIQLVMDKKIKFLINSDGLKTFISSDFLRAHFPNYEPIFEATGSELVVNTQLFSDNISNIRKSLSDETYRIRIIFEDGKLKMTNTKANSHLEFSNENLSVSQTNGQPFEFLVNAFLLEGLLALLKCEEVKLIVSPDNKPLILLSQNTDEDDPVVRAAIALAQE